jgi:type II secretion system protein D
MAAALGALVVASSSSDSEAQKRPRPRRPRPTARGPIREADANTVTINYPDSVRLSSFVDYVSESLNVKILYGDEVRNQAVVFRPSEVDVPKSQLLDLLRAMLRMQDLALVEGDVDGWLRIVQAGDLQRHASKIRHRPVEEQDVKSNRVITQVVTIASEDMQRVVKHLRSFLSSSKASVIEVPDKNLVIVTDYESAINKALEIVKLIDSAPTPAAIATVPIKHQNATTVAKRVAQVLSDKAKIEGVKDVRVAIHPDPETSIILLVGPEESLAEVKGLIAQFDVPTEEHRLKETYAPRYITANRLMHLFEGVVANPKPKGELTKLFLDEQANRLYVTAPADVHEGIRALLEAEDRPGIEPARPLRIYHPKNRLARDLIGTLAEVLPNVTASLASEDQSDVAEVEQRLPPGPNRPPGLTGPGETPPIPPARKPIETTRPARQHVARVQGDDFVLSYDSHTNSIITVGPREFHVKLRALMEALDKRQPQVLIAMTLVAVTFNDSFSLAVELANEEKTGRVQSLAFSSFGLSSIDLTTGERAFNPGGGLNGVILGPHETPILIRTIAAHGDSRIITTPKIIVADNTTASISNVEEAPFTSINASDTVATTSFAGFESAGTTLTVTPHIAQGDHLRLDYSFNFSNFTGGGSVGVPPPRSTNTFSGTVEIPDNHTIILGGMVTENEADSVTEVPVLGRIPVVGALFQSSDRARTKSRIYALIRATVLRDDQFADLKLITQGELERADLASHDYPASEYAWMR